MACAGTQGSILLESVIVLPLFMVLIGGTLWLGDLILAKQRLVLADRYAAWNCGNRHGGVGNIAAGVQRGFFPDKQHQKVTVNVAGGDKASWEWEAFGGVDLEVRMPAWIRGWLSVGSVWPEYRMPESTIQRLHGRTGIAPGPSGRYEGHVVLMRAPWGEQRNGRPASDLSSGERWQQIGNEPWPY